jgi:activator of HSP90 ATPase
MKTINQTVKFKVSPHEVYETLMDSEKHAAFTGQEAEISREVGGKIKAFEGWVEGENLELEQDKKIVQKWRGKDWKEGEWSKVTFELKEIEEGTELILIHEEVPDDKFESVGGGWKEHYWDKMEKYFKKEE